MGRKCYVQFCKSGYASCPEKVRSFKAPSDPERLAAWDRAIGRQDKRLTDRDLVCEKHFTEDMLIRGRYFAEHCGIVILDTPKRVVLKPDAVPTLICKQAPSPVKESSRKQAGTATGDRVSSTCPDSNPLPSRFVRVKGESSKFCQGTMLNEISNGTGEDDGSRPMTDDASVPMKRGNDSGTVLPTRCIESLPSQTPIVRIKQEGDGDDVCLNAAVERPLSIVKMSAGNVFQHRGEDDPVLSGEVCVKDERSEEKIEPELTNASSDAVDRNVSSCEAVSETNCDAASSLAASVCVKEEPECDDSWSQSIDESMAFECENSVPGNSNSTTLATPPPGFSAESQSSDSCELSTSKDTPHNSGNFFILVKMPSHTPANAVQTKKDVQGLTAVKASRPLPIIEPSLSMLINTGEVPMPNEAWNRHLITHELTETVCFVELRRNNPAAPFFARKSVEITRRPEGFEIKLRVLDQDISTELVYVDDPLSLPPLVEKLELARRLCEFDRKPVCPGWPVKEQHADLHPECGGIDRTGVWRDKRCLLVLDEPQKVRCRFCCRLVTVLRTQKKRAEKRAAQGDDFKRIRLPLGSTDKAKIDGLRARHRCLARSKARLVKAKEALEVEVHKLRTQLNATAMCQGTP